MSSFMKSSIGRKVLVSLSGLFLMVFLLVHLAVNLTLIFDDTGDLFNQAAHFMATNPAIKIMEPALALGFVIHILYTIIVTVSNYMARPARYDKRNSKETGGWPSRNMFFLGSTILVFLVIHVWNFFWKMRVSGDPLLDHIMIDGEQMENSYNLVATLFKTSYIYSSIYILGVISLGLHLSHGFWSAFHTIGLNNDVWMPRLRNIAVVYAAIIAGGFIAIPVYFMIFF
ncbi:MAG: succinate dehydrogenase cytochrome b subunit [Salinivirgaceae bacterium]|nr:succinate dehydrogenase cytochrome b subunit [Salinivirgaceae bacterium]